MTFSIVSVVAALLLLAVPAYVLFRFEPMLLQRFCKSFARMLVQLGILGVLLWYLWRVDSVWVTLLALVALSALSAFVSLLRARLRCGMLFLPAFIGMLVGVGVVSTYLVLAVIRPEHPFAARWMLPVGGILLMHTLTTNTHGLSAYYGALRSDGLSYLTQLGNGSGRLLALTPYVKKALRAMLEPTVSHLSSLGLFGLPMLLSAMLVGGLQPVEAVFLFVVFVAASVCASVISLLVTLFLADRYTFDKRGELLQVEPPVDTSQNVDKGQ